MLHFLSMGVTKLSDC